MDNYQLYEDPIGKGQHSVVYKSRFKKSISYYAIKCIPKKHKATVINQVRILNILNHVNVMKFYSWYETNNHYWIILEYCTGGDLFSILNADEKLPESTIQVFALDLVNGLQHVHANGFIWCDLKPSNILLNGTGMLKLADFGLAQQIKVLTEEDVNLTPDGKEFLHNDTQQLIKAKRGSPCYMSPELFQGAQHSICSDFWALGCVLYQMAVGKPPFVSDQGLGHLMEMIIHDDYEPMEDVLDNVSDAFSDLVNGLLRKDPVERYGWAQIGKHPFFNGEVEKAHPKHDYYLKIPPVFVKWSKLRRRVAGTESVDSSTTSSRVSMEENTLSSSAAAQSNRSVNASSKLKVSTAGGGHSIRASRSGAAGSSQQAVRASVAQIAESKMEREHGPSYAAGGAGPGGSRLRSTTDMEYDFDASEGIDSNTREGETAANVAPSTPTDDQYISASEDESASVQGDSESVVDLNESNEKQNQYRSAASVQKQALVNPPAEETGSSDNTQRPSRVKSPRHQRGESPRVSQHPSHNAAAQKASATSQQLARTKEDSVTHTSSPVTNAQIQPLLFTQVDNYVKPIAHNPRIEQVTPIKYNASQLPFTPMPLEQVLKMPQKQLESFLTVIYRTLAGKHPKSEKLNTLDYFEVLCKDTKSANLLINSSLMKLFIKMLKSNKSPAIRYKLCSVMGLLLRYATFITTELIQVGIYEALVENTTHNNVKVCRKAAATLGELLFYVATQVYDSSRPQEMWTVPPSIINGLIACTKPNKDETVQHYAVKTMENICGHSKKYSHIFTNADSVSNLVHIFQHTPNELLKCSALATLSRMSRHKSAMGEQLISTLGARSFVGMLDIGEDSTSNTGGGGNNLKMIQNSLNIINLSLLNDPDSYSTRQLLELEKKLTHHLMKLLDHDSVTIRSKAIITCVLLCRLDLEAVFRCCSEEKLCDKIERIVAKEKDSHAQKCIGVLIDALSEVVVRVLNRTSTILEDSNKMRVSVSRNKCNADLNVILIILTTPCLSQRAVSANVVTSLSKNLSLLSAHGTSTPTSGPTSASQLVETLLSIVEVVSQQYALSHHYQIVTERLLPTLVQMLNSADSDTRFLSLKIFTDILVRFLNDSSIYDASAAGNDSIPGNGSQNSPAKTTSQMLNQLIISQLLPLYGSGNQSPSATRRVPLLEDIDPIPLYALKLLNNIAEQNVGFISIIRENHPNVIPKLFEFFQLEHKNNNVHNVRLMLKVIASDVLPVEYIYEQNLIGKLISILEYSFENGIESFFEPSLGIVDCLLYKTSRLVQQCQSEEVRGQKETYLRDQANSMYSHNEDFCQILPMFAQLCCHKDIAIAEASSHILLLLSRLYSQTHESIFSSNHLLLIKNALLVYQQSDDSICQFLLKMIYMVVQHSPQLKSMLLNTDKELVEIVRELAESTSSCHQVASAILNKLEA